VLNREVLQLMDPTLSEWPVRVLVNFTFSISQICTSPLCVPNEISGSFTEQATEVAIFSIPSSQSLVTLALEAFQRYTLVASPTTRQLSGEVKLKVVLKSRSVEHLVVC
jgi:hypothetical protein